MAGEEQCFDGDGGALMRGKKWRDLNRKRVGGGAKR